MSVARLFVLCAGLSFALSLIFCAVEIPVLKKLHAGQNILRYVKEHQGKGGTPTMGGIGFVLAAALSSLVFCAPKDKPYLAAVAIGLGYLAVGFLDDYLKKRRGDNLGLRPYQKIAFQFAVALIACLYCCLNGYTKFSLPFVKFSIDLGWFALPVGMIIFLATVNSVNLTDGLDGLASSVCIPFFIALALVIFFQNGNKNFEYLCFALAGALCAYLVFNTNRASVFMGDTGSLSLGGFAAALCLLSGNAFLLPFLGVMFVLSSISVILQVIYYKKTGKRVFLMAPLHHHFQEKGYSEAKICYVYFIVTAVMGMLVVFPYL